MRSRALFESLVFHPFWTRSRVREACEAPRAAQEEYLRAIAWGYLGFRAAAPRAYQRVLDLSGDTRAQAVARELRDQELGLKPVVEASPFRGVPRTQQFLLLVESLLDRFRLELSAPRDLRPLLSELALESSGLRFAVAACDVIEHVSEATLPHLQDFVAKWQTHSGRSSARIHRVFLDELSLLDACRDPEHRFDTLSAILQSHAELVQGPRYDLAQSLFVEAIRKHWDLAHAHAEQALNGDRTGRVASR